MGILKKKDKKALWKSSRQAVGHSFGRVKRHMLRDKWLANNNSYRSNCIKMLEKHTKKGNTVIDRHLGEYIAASGPLHCADGWSLLGRAVDCHARGDADSARHFGYYAELRAAMALLATEGIGIFSDRHFVLEESGKCRDFPKKLGTHRIAWLSLEHWAGLRRSAELLGEIISPGGVLLRDWRDAFQAGVNVSVVGGKWLKMWGLDLRRLADDRDARNEASYRPTRLNSRIALDVIASLRFLRSLWSVCEPSPASRFDRLDRHLLRLTIEEAYRGIKGRKVTPGDKAFEAKVSSMLEVVTPEGLSRDEWKNFLMRSSENEDSPLIKEAEKKSSIIHPRHHVQVIARAALLLRIATGACSRLLQQSGLSRSNLMFWWASFGTDHGLWDPGNEPQEATDLWADVETALERTNEWEMANATPQPSYHRWRQDCLGEISVLGSCERIALWGMGL